MRVVNHGKMVDVGKRDLDKMDQGLGSRVIIIFFHVQVKWQACELLAGITVRCDWSWDQRRHSGLLLATDETTWCPRCWRASQTDDPYLVPVPVQCTVCCGSCLERKDQKSRFVSVMTNHISIFPPSDQSRFGCTHITILA